MCVQCVFRIAPEARGYRPDCVRDTVCGAAAGRRHPSRARMPILEGKWALLAVCILLAAEGRAGAAQHGHSRVRHFPGVVTFLVVKSLERAARVLRGIARLRSASPVEDGTDFEGFRPF